MLYQQQKALPSRDRSAPSRSMPMLLYWTCILYQQQRALPSYAQIRAQPRRMPMLLIQVQ
jgi:hypothetical protein